MELTLQDIPLVDAVIIANTPAYGHKPYVSVVRRHDPRVIRYDIDLNAAGDHCPADPNLQLGFLFSNLWQLTHAFAIPTEIVHEGVCCIPEYRESASF